MKTLAVYSMKGGVGKTTTAVTLSYLAATSGLRTLVWDLDPQAASSFAFRVRPRVAGFGRKAFTSGDALNAAIRETDYPKLDILPADFAYRKIERLLDRAGRADRVFANLLETIGQDYDLVILDCPAGFSLLTEGIFAAADVILMPTIPTMLSLRMVSRLLKWAGRAESPVELVAFFNMVDRRKALHRRACEWSLGQPDLFLSQQVPYASIVEQVAVRRTPLPVFAAREAATASFVEIWEAVRARLFSERTTRTMDRAGALDAIESFIEALEAPDAESSRETSTRDPHDAIVKNIVHRFDTDRRDLAQHGFRLELHERPDGFAVAAGAINEAGGPEVNVRVDRSWALEILSGALSPLVAIERRVGRPGIAQQIRTLTDARSIRRMDSRHAEYASERVVSFATRKHA